MCVFVSVGGYPFSDDDDDDSGSIVDVFVFVGRNPHTGMKEREKL